MNIVGKTFRHYKGNVYKVAGEATDSETLEPVIIYVEQSDTKNVWVRPKVMFLENVIVDGLEMPRFEAID